MSPTSSPIAPPTPPCLDPIDSIEAWWKLEKEESIPTNVFTNEKYSNLIVKGSPRLDSEVKLSRVLLGYSNFKI
jgi:hypothetical protein